MGVGVAPMADRMAPAAVSVKAIIFPSKARRFSVSMANLIALIATGMPNGMDHRIMGLQQEDRGYSRTCRLCDMSIPGHCDGAGPLDMSLETSYWNRTRAKRLSPDSSPKQATKSLHSAQLGAAHNRYASSRQIMRKKNFFHFMSCVLRIAKGAKCLCMSLDNSPRFAKPRSCHR